MKLKDQDNLVYKFEDGFLKAAMYARAPRKILQEFADKACRRWGVPLLDVVFSTSTRWSGMYYWDQNKIRLFAPTKKSKWKRNGRNLGVLMHEVAHHIDDWKIDAGAEAETHGPNFVAIVMDLYDHYDVLPKPAFKLMAKKIGIKIAVGIHHKMKKRASARRRKAK